MELEIEMSSSEIGEKTAYFVLAPTDGMKIAFQVQATFIGPIVWIVEPTIDFGLMKINS